MKLSERLQKASHFILPDLDVWDICCDHGYLGLQAYQSQKFKNIYFVDPVPSIINRLQKNFVSYFYQESSLSKAFFLTEKAQDLNQDIEGTICILGVGGGLIENILQAFQLKNILKARRVVLSPHKDIEHFLIFMETLPFVKTLQVEIVERGRSRQIFIFDRK
jgi:tRNA (adenine22-N1)-methyltransferase